MKIVAGEGKKERNFGRSGGGERESGEGEGDGVGGEVGGGGPAKRESGVRPNLGRTDENFEHTPHRHTTQHNGGSRTGWSWAGVPRKEVHGPKKSRHEQQSVPKSSPIGQSSHRFGHRTV